MTEKADVLSYLTSFRFTSKKPRKHRANDNTLDTLRFVSCLKINT